MCCEEAEGATNIWYVKPVVYHRAVRRIENIGASRFGMYGFLAYLKTKKVPKIFMLSEIKLPSAVEKFCCLMVESAL